MGAYRYTPLDSSKLQPSLGIPTKHLANIPLNKFRMHRILISFWQRGSSRSFLLLHAHGAMIVGAWRTPHARNAGRRFVGGMPALDLPSIQQACSGGTPKGRRLFLQRTGCISLPCFREGMGGSRFWWPGLHRPGAVLRLQSCCPPRCPLFRSPVQSAHLTVQMFQSTEEFPSLFWSDHICLSSMLFPHLGHSALRRPPALGPEEGTAAIAMDLDLQPSKSAEALEKVSQGRGSAASSHTGREL